MGLQGCGDGTSWGMLRPEVSHPDWWSDCKVHVSELGLLGGKDGAVNGWPRIYDSPLGPAEATDTIAKEGGQIGQLRQQSNDSKYLGEWCLQILLCQTMDIGSDSSPFDQGDQQHFKDN